MTDTPPKVSVVCAWYNRADYIRDTIDSLLAQDLDDFEVIAINDGSLDPNVREILDRYDDRRLRVVHQANVGFTATIKRAISLSKAPYIAIQGAGDISFPTRLRRQLDVLEKQEDVAIVGCGIRVFDVAADSFKEVVNTPAQCGSLTNFGFSQGELMYRRAVYEKVGGYRELMKYGQGGDLWRRMLRDHHAVIVPSIEYEQRLFADGVSKSAPKKITRRILNALSVENEITFRNTGLDHFDEFGAAAFSILAHRPNAKKAIVSAYSAFSELEDADAASKLEVSKLTKLQAHFLRSKASLGKAKKRLLGVL